MSCAKRILVLGRSGQVAQALGPALQRVDREIVQVGRAELDLSDEKAAYEAVTALRPDIVVNAAAYTAVDKAEDDHTNAFALNADGPGAAARAAASLGAPFIHFSTDYVFDGAKREPYVETDSTRPLGVYGESKLAGERAVLAGNPRSVILRTAWVCSAGGSNFLRTMLRLAGERDELRVVDDQHGAPTFARDLAAAVDHIIGPLSGETDATQFGVFHLASAGETTWCGFARAIMQESAVRGGPHVPVQAIATADYPTRARRPQYSRLDTQKIARTYGVRLPPWRESLAACMNELHA